MQQINRLVVQSDLSLKFLKLSINDGATYWCVVKQLNRPASIPAGKKVHLVIHSPPVFEKVPSPEIFKKLHDNLNISCQATGNPLPEITWLRDGERLEEEKIQISKGYLTIQSLKESDAGKYSCLASNDIGQISYDIRIQFSKGAYFEHPISNVTAVAGSELFWPCHAKAEPPSLHYKWLKGEKEIAFLNTGLPFRSKVENGNLKISPVQEEDHDWYSCVAENGFGKPAISSAFLNVYYSPRILPSTPGIQYIAKGKHSSIYCKIEANPHYRLVVWKKDNDAINFIDDEKQTDIYLSSDGSKLHFYKGDDKHAGAYSCQAYNEIGASLPFEVLVVVSEPPYFTSTPPSHVELTAGSDVSLSCSAEGYPKPKIEWKTNNGTIYSTSVIKIWNASSSDYGEYECTASNPLSVLKRKTLLKVLNTVPQPLDDVEVSTNTTTATLKWKPGFNGGHTQHYTIRYRLKNAADEWTVYKNLDKTEITLDNLQPDEEYSFEIIPYNSNGIGKSFKLDAKTKENSLEKDSIIEWKAHYSEKKLPVKPDDLKVKISLDTILLSWSQGRSRVKTVHNYSVEYQELKKIRANKFPDKAKHSDEHTIQSKLIRDRIQALHLNVSTSIFERGADYKFMVRSHTEFSKSEPASIAFRMPDGRTDSFPIFAGLLGGLLFLVFFLLIAFFCAKFLLRRAQKAQSNGQVIYEHDGSAQGKMPILNGALPDEDSSGFEDRERKGLAIKFALARNQSRIPSLTSRLNWNKADYCSSKEKNSDKVLLASVESVANFGFNDDHQYEPVEFELEELGKNVDPTALPKSNVERDKQCHLFLKRINSNYFANFMKSSQSSTENLKTERKISLLTNNEADEEYDHNENEEEENSKTKTNSNESLKFEQSQQSCTASSYIIINHAIGFCYQFLPYAQFMLILHVWIVVCFS
ncbi:putative immunoglobulin I-set domain protein [Trichinella nativa]|uniref:Putative immunoglobulin I-set domain protein n=1 Tax=Trichinella nativa TaxID=6335 RepID=A0A1Y3EG10_9BILA|nr:putative immunoglobulin I-set domain protein [Trichinella nativa]